MSQSPNDLKTVEQFSKDHPAFTQPALRALIFNARNNANGLEPAFKRIGRRVYVDEGAFFRCVVELNAKITRRQRTAS